MSVTSQARKLKQTALVMFSKVSLAFDAEDGGVEIHQELAVSWTDQSEVTLEELRLKVLPCNMVTH
jgi:hypothetical protein